MKKSFVLYTDQEETIDSLTDAQAGKFLKAFYDYHSGKEVELDHTLSLLFISFKQTFIRNEEKYQKKVEANRINGRLGGRPKTQPNPHEPKKPNGIKRNPKNLDSDSDSDIAKLASLLGSSYKNENGKHFRLLKNGWSEIKTPKAYIEKIKTDQAQPREYKEAKEMSNEELQEYFSDKEIGKTEGIKEDYVFEALERGIQL